MGIRVLNLTLVRSFVGLVDAGSFSVAAERLNIAQPTLSQHVKRLEQHLGVPLIERSHAGSRPTRHGRRFLPHARRLLSSALRATEIARDDCFMVGCSGNIAGYFMSKEMKRFLDTGQWSGQWEIVSAPNPQIAEKLLDDEVDLAVMEWPFEHPDIVVQPWRSAEMIVILPPEHPLAALDEISVDEFLGLEMIGGEYGSGTGTLLRKLLGTRAEELKTKVNVGSTEAVKQAVVSGLGASIVLAASVEDDLTAGTLKGVKVADTNVAKVLYTARAKSRDAEEPAARLAKHLTAEHHIIPA